MHILLATILLCPIFILHAPKVLAENTPDISTCSIERVRSPFITRDQGDTSTCWLHSALQMMEQSAGLGLSVDALLIPEIKSRAYDRFLGFETPWDGGAGPTRPFALALEHGLVPESAWKSKSSIVKNYDQIFLKIEDLLSQSQNLFGVHASPRAKKNFLKAVDNIIMEYTGSLPPTKFRIITGNRTSAEISAVDFARQVIGDGDSRGYDFRNIQYSEKLYGRMPDVAWTTIISRDGELKKITDIIEKRVDRVTAEEAFQKVIQIFQAGRPVAFTFIWANENGEPVLGLNKNTYAYEARLPAVTEQYTSSHLVLISGLIKKDGQVVGFEVLDPLPSAQRLNNGFRILTREFFNTHGKTVHEIAPRYQESNYDCSRFLSAQFMGY